MPVAIEMLSVVPPPEKLSEEEAQLVASSWMELRLRHGEQVWREGAPAPELALLLSGKLSVSVEGEQIGTVRKGDLFGETSVFAPQAQRSATLTASEPSLALLISTYDLTRLRHEIPSFYDRLLDLALQVTAKRIRATDLRIAKLSSGIIPAPAEPPGGMLRSLKCFLRTRSLKGCPPLEPLLRDLPGMRSLSEAGVSVLGKAFQAQPFLEGDLLLRQGEEGSIAYLLAKGEVSALRHVRHRKAEVLADFQPGDFFGAVTLVAPGTRTATCQAETDGWVYRMDGDAYQSIEGEARITWKESVAAALSLQLRNANLLLAGFQAGTHTGGPLPSEQLKALLRASGALYGGRAHA